MNEHQVVIDLLPAFEARVLSAEERADIWSHVSTCKPCRVAALDWKAIARAARAGAPTPQPRPAVLEAILERAQRPGRPQVRFVVDLLAAQAHVLRPEIWPASAFVMVVGFALALIPHAPAGAVLALVAPIVAAAGVSLLYGPQSDPSFELVVSTPTSPRLVLLARLALVSGYDILLATAASIALAVLGYAPDGLGPLIGDWLGPLLLVASISLSLSVVWGPTAGQSVALGLWGIRVWLLSTLGPHEWVQPAAAFVLAVTSTNVITALVAVLITLAVLIGLPFRQSLEST